MVKMKNRELKENDRKEIDRAYELIVNIIKTHPETESAIWVAANFSIIARFFQGSGYSHEEFCEKLYKTAKDYKPWWGD